MSDLDEIGEVTSLFFGAFSNCDGPPAVDVLYDICLAEAVIVNATTAPPVVYDLANFVEPRRSLLQSGRLTNFQEYEVSENTSIYGQIAQRTSRYEKTWTEENRHMRAAGTKVLSFVKMQSGWKIASVLWHDETPAVRR